MKNLEELFEENDLHLKNTPDGFIRKKVSTKPELPRFVDPRYLPLADWAEEPQKSREIPITVKGISID